MASKTFCYARVSSRDQNLNRQIDQLQQYVLDPRDIITDMQSGKDFKRENYKILKEKLLRNGDTLVVCSMDRLGRNKQQILKELQYFREQNIRVKILDIPTTMLDIENMDNSIAKTMLEMVNNVLIEVLATMAQAELETIKKRQAEGIQALKDRNGGKGIGRPEIDYPVLWEMYYTQWRSGFITANAAMESLGLKRNTFYKLANKYKEEHGE